MGEKYIWTKLKEENKKVHKEGGEDEDKYEMQDE